MIYLARLLFLIGSTLMTAGIGVFAFKVLFEKDIPAPYQGYWLEVVGVIVIALLITGIAQLLGNDIAGQNRATLSRATDSEFKRFHESSHFDRYITLNFYSGIFSGMRGILTALAAVLGHSKS